MSELTFNLLRLGYLLLLWFFVLSAVAVLRRDISIRGRSSAAPRISTPAETAAGPWVDPNAAPGLLDAPRNLPTPPIAQMSPPIPLPVIEVPGAPAQQLRDPAPAEPIIVGPAASSFPNALPQPLPHHSQQPQPPQPQTPRYLAITGGPLSGSLLPLSGQPITIGRAASNTLVCDDDYASGHHARIFPTPQGWVVEDLGSTNGTFVNGSPLLGTMMLPIGTPVTIGHSELKLVV